MHLLRKWINSDLISSGLLLFFFFFLNISNSKPYTIINHKAVIPRDDRSIRTRHLVLFGVVFLIVAMAVGTKRLAFGITISAFVLLVLEYVGSFSCFTSRSRRDDNHQSQDYANILSCNFSDTSLDDQYATSSGEIGVRRHQGDDIIVTKQNVMDEKKMTGGEEEFIIVGAIEILGTEKRRSRRAIFKENIVRRLVPKKFRHSKYSKGSEWKFEDHSTTRMKVMDGGSSVGSLTIRRVISEVESDSEEFKDLHFPAAPAEIDEGKQSWPSVHSLKSEADCVMFGSGHPCKIVVRRGDVLVKSVTSNIEINERGKSGYVMLVVIVLAGLLGGRILSFFLAISYCCILSTIRRKESSKPIFTSTVPYTV